MRKGDSHPFKGVNALNLSLEMHMETVQAFPFSSSSYFTRSTFSLHCTTTIQINSTASALSLMFGKLVWMRRTHSPLLLLLLQSWEISKLSQVLHWSIWVKSRTKQADSDFRRADIVYCLWLLLIHNKVI